MRCKVLRSDNYKQTRKDGTLDSKQLTIVPMEDYTIEEFNKQMEEILDKFLTDNQAVMNLLSSKSPWE